MGKKNKNIKPHIGIFGRRNAGKSSLINKLTGQDIAIVSDIAGTTTDPVKKSVEIFGIGPAIIIDTAGIDDQGELGMLRIKKTENIISQIDLAILVFSQNNWGTYEQELVQKFEKQKLPFLIVHNKSDLIPLDDDIIGKNKEKTVDFSCKTDETTEELIKLLVKLMPQTAFTTPSLFEGIVKPKDVVLLVTPIDSEAPEGRMILPQVMSWRHLLDEDCICMSVKDTELEDFLKLNVKPDLIVTDSQVFDYVAQTVPSDIPLTSFSIVLARYKGRFKKYIEGAKKLAQLQTGDKVLILESCTHQVSCEDIGRVKIPNWLKNFTDKTLDFEVVAGFSDIKYPPKAYAVVIQCGGCVVTRKQLQNRLQPFIDAGIPVTNYGMAIAVVNGIFNRVIAPFERIL